MPAPSADSWVPTAPDLAALDEAGQRFLGQLLEANVIAAAEAPLALELAHTAASLSHARTLRGRSRSTKERLAVERLLLQLQKQFANLMAQLRGTHEVEDDGATSV
jgi:hypothetical protein